MTLPFAHPHLLWSLLAVPLAGLLWWHGWRQRQQMLQRLGEQTVLARLLDNRAQNGRFAHNLLTLIAIAATAIALARPQWGSQTKLVRQQGLQILFVLDISPSMLVSDTADAPNRLELAKQTIATLMTALPQHEMGVVLFSGSSQPYLSLSPDHATLQTLLAQVSPDLIPRPGTAVAQALHTARRTFNQRQAIGRVIILLSDGEDHEAELAAAVQTVQEANITLYTIGVGSSDGGPVPLYAADGTISLKRDADGQPIISRANVETLQQLATQANGRYFPAAAHAELVTALAQLEQTQQNGRWQTRPIDWFPLFLLLAWLALFVGAWLPLSGRKTAVYSPPTTLFTLLLFITLATTACRQQQQTAQAIHNGNQAFATAQFDTAHQAYQTAQALTTTQAAPYYNQANVFYRQALFNQANQTMHQAIPHTTQTQTAAAFHNLGNSYFRQKQWSNAITAYQAALRHAPNDLDTKYNLELARQMQRDLISNLGTGEEEGSGQNDQSDAEQPQNDEDNRDQPQPEKTIGQEQAVEQPEQEVADNGQPFMPAEPAQSDDQSDDATQEPVEGLSETAAYTFLTEIGQHAQTIQGALPELSNPPPKTAGQKDW